MYTKSKKSCRENAISQSYILETNQIIKAQGLKVVIEKVPQKLQFSHAESKKLQANDK